MKNPGLNRAASVTLKHRLDDRQTGLLLMDLSLNPIAYDHGAGAILTNQTSPGIPPEPRLVLPKAALDLVSNLRSDDRASLRMCIDHDDYICTFYLMESRNESGGDLEQHWRPKMVAVHMEKVACVTDAVAAVAAKYNLTEREGQTLSLLSLGLCSKELAEKMNISPNTVKVFLRLIMLKMGVSTRGEIVAEIIKNQNGVPALQACP